MHKNRKYVEDLLYKIKSLKDNYKSLEENVIRIFSQTEYSNIINHYDFLIEKLTEELMALPIGHRYIGTFYLKKPYIIPAAFEKCEGVIFMQASLVSWQIEKGTGIPNQFYYRNVFKEPAEGTEMKREDATPVYARTLKEAFDSCPQFSEKITC